MKTRFNFILIIIILGLFGCTQATTEPTITPRQYNYVALGDSIPVFWGVGLDCFPNYFADYLQQDLGEEVHLQNMAINGDRTAHLLDHLQNDAEIRQAVADANLITIWIGVNDLSSPQMLYMNGLCGGEDNLNCVRKRISEIIRCQYGCKITGRRGLDGSGYKVETK